MQARRKGIDTKRNAILREAKTLFRKRGLASTTMDMIAKASGLSKSTVYVYFKSKEDIFLHLVLEGLYEVRETVRQLTNSFRTRDEQHHAVCDYMVEMHDRDPVLFQGIIGNGLVDRSRRTHPHVVGQIDALREEIIESLLAAFFRFESEYQILPGEPGLAQHAYIVWACLYGIISVGEGQSRYIHERFGTDRRSFMKNAFDQLPSLLVHFYDAPCTQPTGV